MSTGVRVLEHVSRRMVAGLRPVSAVNGTDVSSPVEIRAEGLIVRRGPGIFGLEPETWALNPAGEELMPAPESQAVTVELVDPTLGYLPRAFQLAWPADPIWEPLPITMLPSPIARVQEAVTVLRGTVVNGAGAPLGGVLIRASFGGRELGLAMSAFVRPNDPRTRRWTGQYLLQISGLSPVQWGNTVVDPVRLDTVNLEIETATWGGPGLPDVEALHAQLAGAQVVNVQPGRSQQRAIVV